MKQKQKFSLFSRHTHVLYFLPLIIAGGRLATRIVLNLWNMFE